MTSVLDQFEQASQSTGARPTPPLAALSSGYVSLTPREDTPPFSKQKMNFNPSDIISHVAVGSDQLVLAMANAKMFRIDLKNPDKHEEISISKYVQASSKLTNIFMDPLGCHLLLSFSSRSPEASPELLYLHRKSSKPKGIRSRSSEVTEVAWNRENRSETSTGPILLGTSKGLILETELGPEGDKMFQSGIEQYWKQLPNYLPLYGNREEDGLVFDIGKGTQTPITGLEFHRLNNSSKYVIFVTTPKRLYHFTGLTNPEDRPLLQPIFNTYLNIPETGFQELLSSLSYSRLQFHYDKTNKNPVHFAWLTDQGIFHGEFDSLSQENSNSTVLHGEMLTFPPLSKEPVSPHAAVAPISFVLTEFHALILYEDHVKAICLLNEELVYQDYYSEAFGKLLNIVKDPIKKTIWAITTKAVFRYKVYREERNVWQIYTDRNEFELAKKYCDNNPVYIDKINVKHAELLFGKGEYEKSAEIYANTQSSFEAICLKFLQAQKIDALMLFLKLKLETLKSNDKIQTTMLVIWIMELYLSQISQYSKSTKNISLQKEFESFLALPTVTECIKRNKSVVYNLMASHGDKENLIKLTVINKDFENVIRQKIYMKQYVEALNVLKSQSKRDLFYRFTPVLMQEIPRQTVTALIDQGKNLSPAKLLPALVSCDADVAHVTEMTRYLEFCVQTMGCSEQAIHNYLLSLYTSHNPAALMSYLAAQGQTASMVNYDIHYALRLCREKQLTEACVQLSSLLGLWEAAVELALSVDLDLAKKMANMPEDQELRKKLWLKIAQFVISGKEEIQLAMQFLQQCDLIKIEDILPFFSDFVTIDHFREPICNSLQEYNQQIQDLREEMEDATKSADQVRNEIQTFRNRCTVINVSELCVLCDITLLLRPFYLFPCGHKFHSDCLLTELQPLLGPAKKNKLADLQRQLNSPYGAGNKEHLRSELDSILASECLYCGEYMIRAIDTPFIPDADWDKVMKEWE